MAIPSLVSNDLLAKCGRHCCICRRFAPLHLQIPPIQEQNEDGTDNPDNLIHFPAARTMGTLRWANWLTRSDAGVAM
jgi:hypothetical protein